MSNSKNWSNYAYQNERLAGSDSNEADRLYHEREQQRAEDRARQEREFEEKQRRDEDDRRRSGSW